MLIICNIGGKLNYNFWKPIKQTIKVKCSFQMYVNFWPRLYVSHIYAFRCWKRNNSPGFTICIQSICPYLRVGWAILPGRGTPLVPTKEAGRGRELRGTADWLALALRGCITKLLLLGLRGCGSAALLGMECRLMEVDRGVEVGPCCTVGLT